MIDHSHDGMLSKTISVINWIAATLGIGTFLGFVNIVVGVLSAGWLLAQLWTHFVYTIPLRKEEMKKLRFENERAQREADRGQSS